MAMSEVALSPALPASPKPDHARLADAPSQAGPSLKPLEGRSTRVEPVDAASIPSDAAARLTVMLDAETNTFIYKSVDPDSGDVVWQWPSEQVMRVIQYFRRIEHLDHGKPQGQKLDRSA
jgi:hypothetical protein